MTSFYAGLSSNKTRWYNDGEIDSFCADGDSASAALRSSPSSHAADVEREKTSGSRGYVGQHQQELATPLVRDVNTSTGGGMPSFYGKGPGNLFRQPRAPRPADSDGSRRDQAMTVREDEPAISNLPGSTLSVLPKRPPREAVCRDLDKEISSASSPADIFTIASREEALMDAANWANLIYALAHCHKKSGPSADSHRDQQGGSRRWQFANDSRWIRVCTILQSFLPDLTARDAANVLWSMATLGLRDEPFFLEAADALRGKMAVCDPISVSKAAWALTAVPNRDKRLELFNHLAVPVVLRAEVFPIGALTMTCYAFGKAAHRDANVFDALSNAIMRYSKEDLRPIDVCNVIWAFCTVGYRDDRLFNRICEDHLTDEKSLANYNPQDLTNTAWGLSKVVFTHEGAMRALAKEGLKKTHLFKPIHFTNFIYSFATLRLNGPEGFFDQIADAAIRKLSSFDSANLSIIVWSMAMLKERHALQDEAVKIVQKPEVCQTLTSRTLSMLFLAYFRFGRVSDADIVFDAAIACGTPIGASGFSAVVMTAEQGPDGSREMRVQQAMAHEADDDRMRACITNAAAIRQMKRGRPHEAYRLLSETRAAHPKSWSSVSARLMAQVAPPEEALAITREGTKEIWVAPVQSGIHPIAATRQNEGPHAYTREMMTLQAVLCGAPEDDVDACMTAVEQFAESRSLWLKITAWEKAVVVHEVAKLNRPGVVVEIGAYVGYSAMNLARAVRPFGGRVASIEVDPVHATIVRNMVEYAGLTDTVDVWTGYCYDVIPHLLDKYGPRSIGMVFMDQKGTRFHTDLGLMEDLDLLADGAVVLADNVLKPGAPLYIWQLAKGPFTDLTAVSVREFLLQSEDWMVMGFHDATLPPTPEPPPELHRIAFESDAFRKRSMFDSVAPSKADWWNFSQRFVDGLQSAGCKPRIVGLHGRDNPVIQPKDVAAIFERAGRLPKQV